MSRMHSPKRPTPDQADFLRFWKDEAEQLDTSHILHWSVDSYYPRLAIWSALEPEGALLISMLSRIVPKITVINNHLEDENRSSWEIAERLQEKYGIDIIYETLFHDQREAFVGQFDAVIYGGRRGNSRTPALLPVLKWNEQLGILTVAPLARWKKDAVMAKITQEDIPCGYPVIELT